MSVIAATLLAVPYALPVPAGADAPPIISFGPVTIAHGYRLTGSVGTDGTVYLTAGLARHHITEQLLMIARGQTATTSTVSSTFHQYGSMRMKFVPQGKSTHPPRGCTVTRGFLSGAFLWRTRERFFGTVSKRHLPAVQTLPDEYCRPQTSGAAKGQIDLESGDFFTNGNSFSVEATAIGHRVSIAVDLGSDQYSAVTIDHQIFIDDGAPSLFTVSNDFRSATIAINTPELTGVATFTGHPEQSPLPGPPKVFAGTVRGQLTAHFADAGTRTVIPHSRYAATLDHY